MLRPIAVSVLPFAFGLSLAWGCGDSGGDSHDACGHLEEDVEAACTGAGATCHDACHDDEPADLDAITDCLHDATDCDSVATCVAGTALDGCVPI